MVPANTSAWLGLSPPIKGPLSFPIIESRSFSDSDAIAFRRKALLIVSSPSITSMLPIFIIPFTKACPVGSSDVATIDAYIAPPPR